MDVPIEQIKEAFGHRPFTGRDIAALLHLDDRRTSGAVINMLRGKKLIDRTRDGWVFRNGTHPAAADAPAAPNALPMLKVGGYYIAPQTILIVDTLQDGKVVIFTTILEIDGETKHPRNKRLIFTRQHAPAEYAAVMTWVGAYASTVPNSSVHDVAAALQLAEETSAALQAAQAENKALREKLDQFRSLLG